MALGYEGYVSLRYAGTEALVLGTGSSVPRARQRLESQSGYGGKKSTPYAQMGVAYPRNYDVTVWDGSIDFEVSYDLLKNQIIPWLFDRQAYAAVKISTRKDSLQTFSEVYWSSINLSATSGSNAVTGSISFVALDRDSIVVGGGYIDNPRGAGILGPSPTLDIPDPLNPGSLQRNPIPSWKTTVTVDGASREFTTWTLDFSQEVVRLFSCEHNASPIAPKYVSVGPMTATFSGDMMFVGTTTFTFPLTLATLYTSLDDQTIKLENLELQTDTDSLQGGDSITPVTLEYAAYQLVA